MTPNDLFDRLATYQIFENVAVIMNGDMRPSMGENACTLENMVTSRVQAFSPIVLRDPVTIMIETGRECHQDDIRM